MNAQVRTGLIIMLLLGAVWPTAAAPPIYGPGTLPPLARPLASTDKTNWNADIVYVTVNQPVSFRATTPLGAALPAVDTDTVDGVNTEQGAGTFRCIWEVAGTLAEPVAVGDTISRSWETPGSYLVGCLTDDAAGTVYDDPPTAAISFVTVVVLTADQKDALDKLVLVEETLLPQGQIAEARAILEALLKLDLPPGLRSRVLCELGTAAVASGDFAGARARYLEAMRVPGAPEAQVVHAQSLAASCLFHLEDWPGATAEYEALIVQHPKFREYCAGARYMVALILERQEKWSAALPQFQRVLADYPGSSWTTVTRLRTSDTAYLTRYAEEAR